MAVRLYVGGLPYSTTEEELRAAFEPTGAVGSVSIITDRDSGASRGFGFVEMSTADEAKAAISRLNGSQLGGRTLTVNEAKERVSRSGGGQSDSGRGYGNNRSW